MLISCITSLMLAVSPLTAVLAQGETPIPYKGGYRFSGDIVSVPVQLDGYKVFDIAAAQAEKNDGLGRLESTNFRRSRIENRLQSTLQLALNNRIPPELIQVTTTQLNKQEIVLIRVKDQLLPPIVTVTDLDAEIYSLPTTEVAEEYRRQTQIALQRAWLERQPAARQLQIIWASIIAASIALVMGLLIWGQRYLAARNKTLSQTYQIERVNLNQHQARFADQDATTGSDERLDQHELQRRLDLQRWQRRFLLILQVIVLVSGLGLIFRLFPETRLLGIRLMNQPFWLLLLWVVIAFIILISRLGIDKLLRRWANPPDKISPGLLQRRQKRLPTLSKIWKDTMTILVTGLGVIFSISLLFLSYGATTVITSVGGVGIVASLLFQSLIKDVLNGWSFLLRDVYTSGDIVTIQDVSGVVEQMDLVVTQVRSSPGELITMRNSEITSIKNLSKDWSRMDFTVSVVHDAEVHVALELMQEVFTSMKTDPVWGPLLIDEPDILGVEKIDLYGVLLKIRAKTQLGQQFSITREFQLRLLESFRASGIQFSRLQYEIR
ncbi:MAG: mechanosensitive ion channel domain-containing protein [Kovacikia sp.]